MAIINYSFGRAHLYFFRHSIMASNFLRTNERICCCSRLKMKKFYAAYKTHDPKRFEDSNCKKSLVSNNFQEKSHFSLRNQKKLAIHTLHCSFAYHICIYIPRECGRRPALARRGPEVRSSLIERIQASITCIRRGTPSAKKSAERKEPYSSRVLPAV